MALGDWYLNGTKICPWSFSLSEGKEVFGEDIRILSGALRRDIVARKNVFDFAWEWLPETHDGTYHCYTDLVGLGTKSGTVAFIRPTGTSSGTTSYNVFCECPSADKAERLDGTDIYWNVSMTVREA